MLRYLAIPVLCATGAAAEESVVVATCADGGCDCQLSDLGLRDAEALLGAPPPEGVADPVVVVSANGFLWSDETAEALDARYGGAGTCEPEMFPAVTPRDGTWHSQAIDHALENCSDAFVTALTNALGSFDTTAQMAWGGVFDPGLIGALGTGVPGMELAWSKVTDDRYLGRLPLPAQTGRVRVSGGWDSRITDPDTVLLLDGVQNLRFGFLGSLEVIEVSTRNAVLDTSDWVENWVSDVGVAGGQLSPPVALEIHLELLDWGEIRRLYALPPL